MVSDAITLRQRPLPEDVNNSSTITTQGRLHCPQRVCYPHRETGFILNRNLAFLCLGKHLYGMTKETPQTEASLCLTEPLTQKLRIPVSTEKGSAATCHCGLPLNLNSQHLPQTGRKKQTQGTSSICPLMDF